MKSEQSSSSFFSKEISENSKANNYRKEVIAILIITILGEIFHYFSLHKPETFILMVLSVLPIYVLLKRKVFGFYLTIFIQILYAILTQT